MKKNLSLLLARMACLGLGFLLPLLPGCASKEVTASSDSLPGSGVSSGEISQILAYHNRKRQEVGSPNLRWSPEIARYAQS